MQKCKVKLTVFFDAPFWVGVCERYSDGRLEVCKITFGSEPKDNEIYNFILKNWNDLEFSPSIDAASSDNIRINPKRMQRDIKKQLKKQGVGTKAQQALKLQHEANKVIRKKKSREQKEAEKQRKFELHQLKRKKHHCGK